MKKITSAVPLEGKTVLLRADLNVPLENGKITDDGRIRAALPSIKKIIDAGAKLVIVSHLGRPGGKVAPELTLAPVAERLGDLLGKEVSFSKDTIGEDSLAKRSALENGDVLILENLRFNEGETSKDSAVRQSFAQRLAAGADLFVSDGFGVVHRQQASVTELAAVLPSYAGLLVEHEVSVLEKIITSPERPSVVILGGSKVSDKLGVISNLLETADTILIGGGMMFTFLAAKGYSVGSSLCEDELIPTVLEYFEKAEEKGVELVVPTDVVVAESFARDAAHATVAADKMLDTPFGDDGMGLDIGPETAEEFAHHISKAKTVFWNGPMGVFEFEAFANGTKTVAEAISSSEAFSIIGGGDSAAAVRILGFSDDQFGHISTGGGASLELLEGKTLPGLEVLK